MVRKLLFHRRNNLLLQNLLKEASFLQVKSHTQQDLFATGKNCLSPYSVVIDCTVEKEKQKDPTPIS